MSFFKELVGYYDKFHDKSVLTNRFSYADFSQAMAKYANASFVEESLGQSVEGREIKSYTIGKGDVKVLLWSQMHGNESTATRAILDIFQFFNQNDLFITERAEILEKLTIKFIPMLNPDGVERFQRRNAQGVDINRDAQALQAPESRILKKAVDDFSPVFSFNLHDQRRMYNITGTEKPSSISFLAPAYNKTEDINDVREKAMLLIAELANYLQDHIPGGVGRYDDTYTFRAFGDNIQHWGSSTILVESGWMDNDIEKEQVRRLNFLLLITALESISQNRYLNFSLQDYNSIPMNDDKMFDVLVKCVYHSVNGFKGMIDLGVNRSEISIPGTRNFYVKGVVEDLGDLSAHFGFDCIDEPGLCVKKGKIYEHALNSLEELDLIDVSNLLQQGILYIPTKNLPDQEYLEQPINVVRESFLEKDAIVDFEGSANFLLTTQSEEIKYVVLNGYAFKPDSIPQAINGAVIR